MIAIIDYGLGNIRAFATLYKNLNVPFGISSEADDLKTATKVLLPGVGAFDQAMELLEKSGMRKPLEELVLEKKLPILGICVGMQILARSSEEGKSAGLGWIDGVVKRFDPSTLAHKPRLPHMGWNQVEPRPENRLFQGLQERSRFYFLHSYYFECRREQDSAAATEYGIRFSSAVASGNIYGVQFHPEKSHGSGVCLLKNFGSL